MQQLNLILGLFQGYIYIPLGITLRPWDISPKLVNGPHQNGLVIRLISKPSHCTGLRDELRHVSFKSLRIRLCSSSRRLIA